MNGRFMRWEGGLSHGYHTVNRAFSQDKQLTPNAKALMSYLLSLPPGWKATIKNIMREFEGTPAYMGKHFIQTAIKNLESRGYLHRRQVITKDGKFVTWQYHYSDTPFDPKWPKREDKNGQVKYAPLVIDQKDDWWD